MSRAHLVAGVLVVGLALGQGGRDLVRGVQAWSRLGPLRPGERPEVVARWLESGQPIAADLHGRITVLTFWATWCGVCRDELVTLDELDDEYPDTTDVRFVAINREGGDVPPAHAARIAARYAEQSALNLPVAIDDGTSARTFRVGPIPHTVVLDRTGEIRHVHQGRVGADTIRDEIEALRGEDR